MQICIGYYKTTAKEKHRKSIMNSPLRFGCRNLSQSSYSFDRALLGVHDRVTLIWIFIKTWINPSSRGSTNTISNLACGHNHKRLKSSNHRILTKDSDINHKTIVGQISLINHQVISRQSKVKYGIKPSCPIWGSETPRIGLRTVAWTNLSNHLSEVWIWTIWALNHFTTLMDIPSCSIGSKQHRKA